MKNTVWEIRYKKYGMKNTVWKIKYEKYCMKNMVWKIQYEKYGMKNTVWKIRYEKYGMKKYGMKNTYEKYIWNTYEIHKKYVWNTYSDLKIMSSWYSFAVSGSTWLCSCSFSISNVWVNQEVNSFLIASSNQRLFLQKRSEHYLNNALKYILFLQKLPWRDSWDSQPCHLSSTWTFLIREHILKGWLIQHPQIQNIQSQPSMPRVQKEGDLKYKKVVFHLKTAILNHFVSLQSVCYWVRTYLNKLKFPIF